MRHGKRYNKSIEKIDNFYNIKSDRTIFFADDSRFIRKMVQSLFEKFHLKYKLFENGQALLDELKETKVDEIALIITDVEMPVLDGVSLLKKIKELEIYEEINIIVHTNLSNFILEKSLYELGTSQIIGKIDMRKLSSGISTYIQ